MRIPFEVEAPKENSNSPRPPKIAVNRRPSELTVQKALTVTQLTRQITLLLEGKFRSLTVEGELSNVKRSASGHWYFNLKDEQAQIRGVMFRNAAAGLRFEPENGLEVAVRGNLGVYRQRGEYQIVVSSMEPQGLGALQLAFEQLKNKLEKEGLFAPEHKQPLPFLPRKIGIVTSPTGAVIHDMLTVLERRFPGIPVLLFPVQVQGDTAASTLVEGIQYLNQLRDTQQIDVLIVGRGGGSIEDLWAFNDEKLARTIFASQIPVISAVGHETDFTIADFVSDRRAPTPSAAMESAVPQKQDLEYTLRQYRERLQRTIIRQLERLNEYVEATRQRLISPAAMVEQHLQRVDDLDSLLRERTNRRMESLRKQISGVAEKFLLLNPERDLAVHRRSVELLRERLIRAVRLLHQKRTESAQQQIDLLESLSPLAVLQRGYSVTLNSAGKSLRSVKDVQPEDELQVRLKDGTLKTKVLSTKRKSV